MRRSSRRFVFFLTNLWNKSLNKNSLSFFEKYFFKILCFFELFYKCVFFLTKKYKNFFQKKFISSFKIISIGNLSVGGTGKTVFSQFLIKNLENLKGSVVLRGYGGENEKTPENFLVSNGIDIFCDSFFCGDEAFMLANSLEVPIVIGKNKKKSCLILEQFESNEKQKIDYIILDDAYQNFSIKKNVEILLLDAIKPFENGHCLPAGRLREKDFSRADIIIMTHANLVSSKKLDFIKKKLLSFFNYENIFSGFHKVQNLSLLNLKNIEVEKFQNKKFFVFAGIGSFKYFLNDVKKIGVEVFDFKEYIDHYEYTIDDLNFILKMIENNSLNGAITTQKDYSKIYSLIIKKKYRKDIPIYILNITFEFLSKKEDKKFFYFLKKLLKK